jgi:hypothetical protein
MPSPLLMLLLLLHLRSSVGSSIARAAGELTLRRIEVPNGRSGSPVSMRWKSALRSATLCWCAARCAFTNRKDVWPSVSAMATPPLLPSEPANPVDSPVDTSAYCT